MKIPFYIPSSIGKLIKNKPTKYAIAMEKQKSIHITNTPGKLYNISPFKC